MSTRMVTVLRPGTPPTGRNGYQVTAHDYITVPYLDTLATFPVAVSFRLTHDPKLNSVEDTTRLLKWMESALKGGRR